MRTILLITLLVVGSVDAASQQESSQTRAREIAISFNKVKHAVKEKNGVRTEKYKEVHCESVVKPNLTDYSGVYEISDLGYAINIQVASDGRVQASGSEDGRSFRFENARIEAALMTATKIYHDGTAERFEGVFMTRSVRNSPTDSGVTTFGLGVVLRTPVELNGTTYEKLFYQRK
jgi:hypothetical protein